MHIHFADPNPSWNPPPSGSTVWKVHHATSDVVWSSSNTDVATVSAYDTNNQTATISAQGEGVTTITASCNRTTISASVFVGQMYAWGNYGHLYVATSDKWTPADTPDGFPSEEDMMSSGALAGNKHNYIIDLNQFNRGSGNVSYTVSPASGVYHNCSPTIYAYPPSGLEVIIPQKKPLYKLHGNDNSSGHWEIVSKPPSGIPTYSGMDENATGIEWWAQDNVSNFTCYVINWRQIQQQADTNGCYYYEVSEQHDTTPSEI